MTFYTALASPQVWHEKYRESVSHATAERFGQCPNCFAALFSEQLDIYFQREEGTPDGVPYNKAMPIMGTPPGKPQAPR